MSEAHCVWPLAAELGEGPCWVDGALWFVDIVGRAIHRLDLPSGKRLSWPAPARVSFVLPADDGQFIVGLPGEIHRFDPTSGSFSVQTLVERDLPENRLNDACIGPDGALWFDTLDDHQRDVIGSLYRWDGVGDPVMLDTGYMVSNGPAFNPDGRTFYHADSFARTIYAFDLTKRGTLSGKRPHIRIEDGAGWPDGSTIDSDGCLWVALWGGGRVRRYSPQGALLDEKTFPCSQVTKLAFGGEDLTTMFVTTARIGLAESYLAAQPLAGGLFALTAQRPGLKQRQFIRAPR